MENEEKKNDLGKETTRNGVDLQCPFCGAIREIDENFEFLTCDFCGSKEPYVEPESVKLERLKIAERQAREEKEREARAKRELEQAQYKAEQAKREAEKAQMDSIKEGIRMVNHVTGASRSIERKAHSILNKIIFVIAMLIAIPIILIVLFLILKFFT